MGKRRNKDDYEHIRRKIRRLENKLRRNKGKDQNRRSGSSASSSWESLDYERSRDVNRRDKGTDVVDVDYVGSPTSVPVSQPYVPVSVDPNQETTPTLPLEILNILEEANKPEKSLGGDIPTELSERWGKILVDGLAKEQKESLVAKILIPNNFLLAQAPKLNQEVAAVLQEAAKNRDKRLENAQNQLGLGIASLAKLTKDLIIGDLPKLEIIKHISETAQILLDLHFEESINRKKLILPYLDKKFWNTVQGVKRDAYLFGEKLGENIKNTKDIERKSEDRTSNKETFDSTSFLAAQAAGKLPSSSSSQHVRPAPAAPARSYEPQPSTSARRTLQHQRRGHPYTSTRANNERKRRY